MCDEYKKVLCRCGEVKDGEDHWKLEYHATQFPSWGFSTPRKEFRAKHEKANRAKDGILGPLPIPSFEEMHRGIADKDTYWKVAKAEEEWLNKNNPFDFEFTPVEGDRLIFNIGNQKISYSYFENKWKLVPWQKFFADNRMNIDGEKADSESRILAQKYLESGEAQSAVDPFLFRKTSIKS